MRLHEMEEDHQATLEEATRALGEARKGLESIAANKDKVRSLSLSLPPPRHRSAFAL